MRHPFFKPLKDVMRWGLWAPVAMAAGAMLYFTLPEEPPSSVAFITGGVAVGLFLLAVLYLRTRLLWYVPCLGLMWFLLGFTACMLRTALVTHFVLPQPMERSVMAHGTVEQVEDIGKSSLRIILSDVDLWQIPLEQTPRRIRIMVRSKQMPEIAPGDRIAVRVSLSPPPRPVLPGGYDFARMIYFERIGAVGFSLGTPRVLEQGGGRERWLARHRHHITQRIYQALDGHYDVSVSGIAAAMLTGEGGRITKEDQASLRASGLAHVLSISGLHMVLAGSILFVGARMLLSLFPFIVLHYPIKKWAAAASIIASFYYLLIAGMPVPAERAYFMLALFFVAVILDRINTPLRPIALAALLLILLRPESILHPSFQMSFAAVIALCAYFQEPLQFSAAYHSVLYKIGRYLWAIAMSSVVAGLATAPFAFYHFGQYAVYGLLANMLVMPLASFVIMPAGVLAFLVMPLGLEQWPLSLMAEGIRAMLWVSDGVTALPFSTLNLPHMDTVPLVLVVFGGLWICLWIGRVRLLGLAPLVLGLVFYATQSVPDVVLEERGKLFAIHDAELGMLVPARTYARYARQYWTKALGQEGAMTRFDELPSAHPLASCTQQSCAWSIKKVRFFRGADCDTDADVLILTVPLSCRGKFLTITPQDLQAQGSYALWVHGDRSVRVETVAGVRGKRPWVLLLAD